VLQTILIPDFLFTQSSPFQNICTLILKPSASTINKGDCEIPQVNPNVFKATEYQKFSVTIIGKFLKLITDLYTVHCIYIPYKLPGFVSDIVWMIYCIQHIKHVELITIVAFIIKRGYNFIPDGITV